MSEYETGMYLLNETTLGYSLIKYDNAVEVSGGVAHCRAYTELHGTARNTHGLCMNLYTLSIRV